MKSPHSIPYALLTLLIVAACSRQGEGERCLTSNGDSDCEPGFVCTAATNLREYENLKTRDYAADRCCPDTTEPESPDPRCQRRIRNSQPNTEPEVTGGSGGAAGDSAGTAGGPDASTSAGTAGLGA